MQVTSLPTQLVQPGDDLFAVIEDAVSYLPEQSVLVITSKIISICEQRVVEIINGDKEVKRELIRQEADWYFEPEDSDYNVILTIKDNQMNINAGIDESNVDGQYVLWPSNSQWWANEIWAWLRDIYEVSEVGVVITDSKSYPMLKGVMGTSLAHCGFNALRSLIGTPDLYGHKLKVTEVNIAQALAVAGVFEMGEADEQTPLALIEDLPEIEYQDREPTAQELAKLHFAKEQDLFAPVLSAAEWKNSK